MAILGPQSNLDELTESLTPELLVQLAADVLAERGHRGIRITDGPGDGCRDIHSNYRRRGRHLTQCKFKEAAGRSVTSADVGELPLGMLKLKYEHGLFVTNGRISPQAKRELLDNFPDYSLDFLDGLSLAREVSDSAVLSALWISNAKFDRVNVAISVPVILRDLDADRPITLGRVPRLLDDIRSAIEAEMPTVTCLIDPDAHAHLLRFDPYRTPAFPNALEGTMTTMRTLELTFRGAVSLSAVPHLRDAIVRNIAAQVRRTGSDAPTRNFALRLGTPQIVPLSGNRAGARYEVPIPCETFWSNESGTTSEAAMLRPTRYFGDESDRLHSWVERSDARVSESSWVRLFHLDYDICVDCRVTTAPSVEHLVRNAATRVALADRWMRSLFALIPSDSEAPTQLPVASFATSVSNGRLIGWLHPELEDGVLQIGDNSEPIPSSLSPLLRRLGISTGAPPTAELAASIEAVLESAGHTGGLLSPEQARAILMFHFGDPIPDTELVEFRTCDVLTGFHRIPSPLVPACRQVRLEMVWRNESLTEQQREDQELARSAVSELTALAHAFYGEAAEVGVIATKHKGAPEPVAL